MKRVRCEICRQHLGTVKDLVAHYVNSHSKLLIAKHFVKQCLLQATPRVLYMKNRAKKGRCQHRRKTLYSNENLHVLCSQKEIIIRDDKSCVDMEFSFDEASCDSKENYLAQNRTTITSQNVKRSTRKRLATNTRTAPKKVIMYSPSASSEDSSSQTFVYNRKKVVRRKNEGREKLRHYKIKIVRQNESFTDKNGNICSCRQTNSRTKSGGKKETKSECRRCLVHPMYNRKRIRIITSDTDSASDSSAKGFLIPACSKTMLFCSKCGNGYKTEMALTEHMKIHETQCRVCNEVFPTEQSFKKHIESHIFKVFVCHICSYEFPHKPLLRQHFECHMEDSTLDMVVDMEDDYDVRGFNFSNLNYTEGIHSIMHFLRDNHDMYYYSYKFMKTTCDICRSDVFFCDYERHMQTHYSCSY